MKILVFISKKNLTYLTKFHFFMIWIIIERVKLKKENLCQARKYRRLKIAPRPLSQAEGQVNCKIRTAKSVIETLDFVSNNTSSNAGSCIITFFFLKIKSD